ncbi:hypothetical protein QJ856_gp0837 [Tupanvirus deep ocean]|uniref:Uncharacterized protein n=2 Tax=Tupanvirus TaxID=2094720 RepID=A0AC62A8E5_9VIRU|nr:hypothetical protein QJ856_gp0837 [Tupanvirus deep ocean]QKU33918.1 hypothetical protein [Tupanvirus deep ocean]
MPETIHTQNVDPFCNYIITIVSNQNIEKVSIIEDTNFGSLIINNKRKAFYYFSSDVNKISLKIFSESNVFVNFKKTNININQIYIAEHLKHFGNDIYASFPNLQSYNNDCTPAIFYGMWSKNDFRVLARNKSLKIIIWTGSDIYVDTDSALAKKRISRNMRKINKTTKIVHIAISNFIELELIKIGLKYIRIPFMGIEFDKFKPVKKGNSIYIYTSPIYGYKYGENYYSQIINKYKNINFIMTCSAGSMNLLEKSNIKNPYNIKYYNKSELIEKIYPQCFIALRLTKHDGLAGTVQELGAMGIKSIHNGDTPGCLNYTCIEDICKHIENEMNTIGTIDYELSNSVKKYLDINPAIFNTKFYSNNIANMKKVSFGLLPTRSNTFKFHVKRNKNYQLTVYSINQSFLTIKDNPQYNNVLIKKGINTLAYYNDNKDIITVNTTMPTNITIG